MVLRWGCNRLCVLLSLEVSRLLLRAKQLLLHLKLRLELCCGELVGDLLLLDQLFLISLLLAIGSDDAHSSYCEGLPNESHSASSVSRMIRS